CGAGYTSLGWPMSIVPPVPPVPVVAVVVVVAVLDVAPPEPPEPLVVPVEVTSVVLLHAAISGKTHRKAARETRIGASSLGSVFGRAAPSKKRAVISGRYERMNRLGAYEIGASRPPSVR